MKSTSSQFNPNPDNIKYTTHDEKKILYGKVNYKNLPIIAKRAQNLES